MKHFMFRDLGVYALGEFSDTQTGFSIYSLENSQFIGSVYGTTTKEALIKEVKNLINTGFFAELNKAFKEEPNTSTEEPMSDKAKAKNLAWNATDSQHNALYKLEYFIMAHHAYLSETTNGWGEFGNEISGFYLTATELLNELKESVKVIETGLKHG